jgi:lipopolysaccharide transport system permease protein
MEAFRFAYLGAGTFSLAGLAYSAVLISITLLIGILMFNKVERTFMDTV